MSIKQAIAQLFEEQIKATSSFRATLEPVSDAADKVKITPYEEEGCGCERAIIVAIDHIETAERDGDKWHECCGKRLRVCNVTLKPEATVLASDLLARQTQHPPSPLPERASSSLHPEISKCPWCISLCKRNPSSPSCTSCLEDCFSRSEALRPKIAKCPWCVSICRRNPGSRACINCWESCDGDED